MVTMARGRRVWWTALALCGCTQTAEVLTKSAHGDHNAVTPEQDGAVSPLDAGGEPAVTPTSPAPQETSAPLKPPSSDTPDGALPPDETSEPKPLIEAPQLAVGAGHNTTCVIFNQLPVSGLWCFGEAEITPLEGSEQAEETTRGLFVAATGGEHHMCVRDTLGHVYCWGDNNNGQLGDAKPDYAPRPRHVWLPRPVTQLSSGASHVCAITDNGQLYCWGSNFDGQLGVGSETSDDDGSRDSVRREPTLVDEGPWISIAAGDSHTCGVKSDGTLACWGRNSEGQVGNHGETQLHSPRLVNTEHSWKQAVAGQSHSCGLRTDGTLWCWGRNTAQDSGYPLGIETEWQLTDPTPVSNERWRSVATGGLHTCATSESAEIWCWGRNDAGQLGTGDTELRRTATFVRNDGGEVATGRFHSCMVTAARDDVLCTGSNEFGQLALLSDEHHSTFTSLRDELERYVSLTSDL